MKRNMKIVPVSENQATKEDYIAFVVENVFGKITFWGLWYLVRWDRWDARRPMFSKDKRRITKSRYIDYSYFLIVFVLNISLSQKGSRNKYLILKFMWSVV